MESYVSYAIDTASRCVRITYHQQPNFRQWVATMEKVLGDPQFQPGFGILIDRRSIRHPATSEYIRSVVRFIEDTDARTGGARWAFLVGDLASFGMARMAEQLALSDRVRAFRDLSDAQQWLAKE